MGGRLQIYVGQLGRLAGQCLHRQTQTRHDHAAPVPALAVDDRQGGGSAEIEHQQGFDITGLSRHRPHYQVAAQLRWIVDADIKSGLNSAPHQQRGDSAQHSDGPHQDRFQLRYHRGDDGPLHTVRRDSPQGKNIGEEHGVLVLGLGPVGRHPGCKPHLFPFHSAQHNIGVAYVDRQQHTETSLKKPVCSLPNQKRERARPFSLLVVCGPDPPGPSGTPSRNRTYNGPLGGGCYIHLTMEAYFSIFLFYLIAPPLSM